MPALAACGRRWEFGSDDLVIPGSVVVAVRLCWFLLQLIGVAIFHETLSCQHQQVFAAVAYTSIVVTLCVLVTEGAIVIASAQGTVLNSKPRRFVAPLLHCRLVLSLLELLALLVKTGLAAQAENQDDLSHCSNLSTAVTLARVVVAITWFIFACLLVAVLVYLDPCHLYSAKVDFESVELQLRENTRDDEEEEEVSHRVWKLTHSVWEKRFRVLFCFAGSDESHRAAYGEVAEIFAHLFSDTNLVLSDIAAGLVLLQKKHLHRELTLLSTLDAGQGSHSVSLNFCNPSECKLFRDSLHFARFALGVYSWPLHMYMNMCCGICGLLRHMSLPCWHQTRIAGDNACSCGYAGIVAALKINAVDILYASLENGLYQAPFIVCLDHASRSVVVSVRGTLSLHDAITDLTAAAHHIKIPGWPRFGVHKGMYQTASWVLQKMADEDVLAQAFKRVPQYDLVFTGHSLGAGCACLLSIMVREQYPAVHCYCYSPSGSLLTAEGAAYTRTFVTSVTLGQDLVTRLSVPSAHRLKEDVIHALETCRKPKYRILLEGGMETLCKCCGSAVVFHEGTTVADMEQAVSDDDIGDREPLLPSASTSNWLMRGKLEDVEVPNAAMSRLFPPGRIIHIVDTLAGAGRRQLEAHWASTGSFSRVVVSPDMIRDHFPNVMLKAMETVWQNKNGGTLPHAV